MFSSAYSANQVQGLQYGELCFLYDDLDTSNKVLLATGGKSKMIVNRLKIL